MSDPPSTRSERHSTRAAWLLAVGWAITLALLGVLWVQSPFLGHWISLALYTLAAAPLFVWSARWLRSVTSLPLGRGLVMSVLTCWAVTLWLV